MSIPEIGGAQASIASALSHASKKTGADFSYLVDAARRESSFDAGAKSASSSAAGLFQFIEQTWLRMVKNYGAQHGLTNYADKITKGSDGRYDVSSGADRKDVLDLRFDAGAASLMAGELTKENARRLEADLGRAPTTGELYAAHFLGASGASQLIEQARVAPGASAADVFPQAAGANRAVFYTPDGEARSTREVLAFLARAPEERGLAVADDSARIDQEIERDLFAAVMAPLRGWTRGMKLSPSAALVLQALNPAEVLRSKGDRDDPFDTPKR